MASSMLLNRIAAHAAPKASIIPPTAAHRATASSRLSDGVFGQQRLEDVAREDGAERRDARGHAAHQAGQQSRYSQPQQARGQKLKEHVRRGHRVIEYRMAVWAMIGFPSAAGFCRNQASPRFHCRRNNGDLVIDHAIVVVNHDRRVRRGQGLRQSAPEEQRRKAQTPAPQRRSSDLFAPIQHSSPPSPSATA